MRALFFRKMVDIDELRYYTELNRDQPGESYEVTKEVVLNEYDFLNFSNYFMRPYKWIDSDDGGLTEDGKVRCIRVINEDSGDVVLVNSEGYNYARYTALE